MNFTVSATDPNSNNLSYDLVSAPSGASIDATTGDFVWATSTVGTVDVTVKITDDGTPNLSETKTFSITVLRPGADLEISQTDSNDFVAAGNNFSYTLTVNNIGPAAATQVQMVDTLPSVGFISATGTDWTCNQSGNTVTCDLATLAAGATANPITVTVLANTSGTLNNTATVSSSISDPNTANNSSTETTTVTSSNQAPALFAISNQTVSLGDTLSFTATATDFDGNNLTFSLVNPLSGASIDATSGEFTWTPGTTGTFNLTIKVTDDGVPPLSDEETISITISAPPAPNQAPALDSIGNQSVTLGDTLSVTASASDPDGNNLTFSLENAPTGASIDANSGVLTWTADTTGTFNATVKVTDDGVPPLSDEETISITISAPPVPNQAPVLDSIGNQSVTLGNTLSVTASASDPDGNTLKFSLVNAPTGASIDATSGELTWTPDTAGTFNLTVKVTDDGVPPLSDEETISITVSAPPVTAPNQAPVLDSIGNQSIALGDTLSVTASATDPDGNTLKFSLVNSAIVASIDATSGVFTWMPNNHGTFNVTIKVTDDGIPPLSDEETISITVPSPAAEANLGITQTDFADSVTTSGNLTYTLTVNNAGPDAAFNVTMEDSLPTNVTFISATGTDWRCAENSGTVTCDLATLAAGATANPLTVTVSPTACGTLSNTARVKAATDDPDTTNNTVSEDTTVNCFLNSDISPSNNSGSIRVEPTKNAYSQGETVTLTATPKSCYEFSHWAGACEGSSDATCSLTMNANTYITAHFSPKVLTLNTTADNGTIVIEPEQAEYRCNDEVTLTAKQDDPNTHAFLGWMADLSGKENPRYLWLKEDMDITAIFGELGLTVTPAKVHAKPGQVLQFQANGGNGNLFWATTGGDIQPSDATANYTVPNEEGVFYVWVTDGNRFAWALVDATSDETSKDLLVLLRVLPGALNLSVGETQTVSVKGYRIDGTSVDLTAEATLRSEDNNIAQVDSDGQVTARTFGKTRLLADYRDMQTDIPLRVRDDTRVLKVEPNVLILHEGATAQVNVYSVSSLGAKTPFEGAKYNSRDSAIASVTQGTVKGIQTGSTWLDIQAGETSLPIPIVVRPSLKLDITPAIATVEKGEQVHFSVTGGQPPYQMTPHRGVQRQG